MTITRYLDLDDLLRLVRKRSLGPVRDIGLLDSACARPRSTVFGEEAYPGLLLKASALLHSIARNHALVDGNKRLAWLATIVFLDINGARVRLTKDEAFELVMAVSDGQLDVEQIAARLAIA